MNKLILFGLLVLLFLNSCSKEKKEVEVIKKTSQELEMITAYEDAYKALNENDFFFASQKFLEAELLYPQSLWAPKAALMSSYSYYMYNYYSEAVSNLKRYLNTYPSHENKEYAYYLLAMCYYENIEDEKRDSESIIKARDNFIYITENFPNSEFAIDAKFKLDVIQDILASKQMYLGRHYIKQKKWVAAINRFKKVVNEYDKTIFIEEALHRLVEIYYNLGLIEESKKYANLLGYNYLSSEWYEKSFIVFNKDYKKEIVNLTKKNKKNVFDKFITLFE
jgi:outer membrane protein assembly factor BamD